MSRTTQFLNLRTEIEISVKLFPQSLITIPIYGTLQALSEIIYEYCILRHSCEKFSLMVCHSSLQKTKKNFQHPLNINRTGPQLTKRILNLAVLSVIKNVTYVAIIIFQSLFLSRFVTGKTYHIKEQTGKTYHIKEQLSCNSRNVVYLASCNKCSLQYVGSTTTSFKVRFRNHKLHMKNNKRTCEVAIHFNSSPHNLLDFFHLYALIH